MEINSMPEPQTVNYMTFYVVNESFINDYLRCTSQMAYVDVMKVMNIINKHDKVISVAQLNEIVRLIGSFPYKYVSKLMDAINDKTYFESYFVKQPDTFNPGF